METLAALAFLGFLASLALSEKPKEPTIPVRQRTDIAITTTPIRQDIFAPTQAAQQPAAPPQATIQPSTAPHQMDFATQAMLAQSSILAPPQVYNLSYDFYPSDSSYITGIDVAKYQIAQEQQKRELTISATLGYLKTFIYYLQQSCLAQSSWLQHRISMESQNAQRSVNFIVTPIKAIATLDIKRMLQSAFSIVTGIIDAINEQRQIEQLVKFLTNFINTIGPPPTALLHAAQRSGLTYDVLRWEYQLIRYLIDLAAYIQSQGYDLQGAPLVSKESLRDLEEQQVCNLVADGGFSLFKPNSRLGPCWYYAFHPEHLFGRLYSPRNGLKFYSFYHAYKDVCLQKRTVSELFDFTDSDFALLLDILGIHPNSFIFEVGHDPFWYHSGVSTKQSDYLVRFSLLTYPTVNWLLNPKIESNR